MFKHRASSSLLLPPPPFPFPLLLLLLLLHRFSVGSNCIHERETGALSTAGSAWPRFNSVRCAHGVAPLVWEPKLAPERAQDTCRSAKGRISAAAFTEQWRGLFGAAASRPFILPGTGRGIMDRIRLRRLRRLRRLPCKLPGEAAAYHTEPVVEPRKVRRGGGHHRPRHRPQHHPGCYRDLSRPTHTGCLGSPRLHLLPAAAEAVLRQTCHRR